MQRDIINYDITGIKNSLHNKLDTTYKGEMYIYKLLIIIIVYYYTYLSRATHPVTFHFFLFSFFCSFSYIRQYLITIARLICTRVSVAKYSLHDLRSNPHISTPIQILQKHKHDRTLLCI